MKKRAEAGNVLIVVVVLVTGLLVVAVSFMGLASSGERLAAKAQQKDAAVSQLETRLAANLRAATATLLETELRVDPMALAQRIFTDSSGSHTLLGVIEMTDRTRSFEPEPFALMGARPNQSLMDGDDPFQQAPARISTARLEVQMTPPGYVASTDGLDSRPVRARVGVSFRSMPSSAFSLLSNGGEVVLAETTTPDVGRVYARREVGVQGSVKAVGTVVAGERLSADGELSVEGRRGTYKYRGSSDGSDWLNRSRLAPETAVVTGRDLPAAMSLPAPIDIQFAVQQPWDRASVQKQQALSSHADVVLIDDGAGLKAFDAAGRQLDLGEFMVVYETPNYRDGRVIKVDFSRVPEGRQQLALSVQGADSSIVLLVNGASLFGPVTIVSNLPIYVAGNFNEDNKRAVSLVTRQRVVSVEDWF